MPMTMEPESPGCMSGVRLASHRKQPMMPRLTHFYHPPV